MTRRRTIVLALFGAAWGFVPHAPHASAQEPASAAVGEAADEEHTEFHFPLEIPERRNWTFDGPFGRFDPAQLQRGLQVYRQVCGNCHGLERVAFRTLASETGPFLSEEAMEEIAASYRVVDEDTGELREGRATDYFPTPNFPGQPPDLSLMAKARAVGEGFRWLIDPFTQYQEAGVNYIYALLTGYGEEPPAGLEVPQGTFFNPYFIAGAGIGMPPPLFDGAVAYADGSPETVEQYAADVTAFLMWTAEPKLGDRKRLGFQVMIFLVVFAGLAFIAKRTVWSKEH
jgi:ubiquinol-cytochrome c reductase cytochrome c1 subunit